MKLEFSIPGKPKRYQRRVTVRKGGRVWTFDPSAGDKKIVAQYALAARQAHRLAVFAGFVVVTGHFYGLDVRSDLDNAIKLALDAMNGIIYVDDRQVAEIHAYRHKTKPFQTVIEVSELPQ